jgi:hypothetical protein
MDALARSRAVPIAVWCVAVDALHDQAAAWYARFGLAPLPHQPKRLILPTAAIPELTPAR